MNYHLPTYFPVRWIAIRMPSNRVQVMRWLFICDYRRLKFTPRRWKVIGLRTTRLPPPPPHCCLAWQASKTTWWFLYQRLLFGSDKLNRPEEVERIHVEMGMVIKQQLHDSRDLPLNLNFKWATILVVQGSSAVPQQWRWQAPLTEIPITTERWTQADKWLFWKSLGRDWENIFMGRHCPEWMYGLAWAGWFCHLQYHFICRDPSQSVNVFV